MVHKVGRVGAQSVPRFYSQHYTLSAGSTLAKSSIGHPVLWPWLGVANLDATNVQPWMLANLDRLHIFVPAESPDVLLVLEMYARARMGSVYEESAYDAQDHVLPAVESVVIQIERPRVLRTPRHPCGWG